MYNKLSLKIEKALYLHYEYYFLCVLRGLKTLLNILRPSEQARLLCERGNGYDWNLYDLFISSRRTKKSFYDIVIIDFYSQHAILNFSDTTYWELNTTSPKLSIKETFLP